MSGQLLFNYIIKQKDSVEFMNRILLCLLTLLPAHRLLAEPSSSSISRPFREIIEEKYSGSEFYIGASLNHSELGGKQEALVAREFSYVTPGLDFKQPWIMPEPNVWTWKKADEWIERAEKHKWVLRLHCPVSPQASKWAKDPVRTPKELDRAFRDYLTGICKRYNDEKVVRWIDVVNETVESSGAWHTFKAGKGWMMPWERIGYIDVDEKAYPHLDGCIPIYIVESFRIAQEYAPNLKLILNQHAGMEPAMWNKIKDTVRYLRDQGLRVDGIGWQAHIRIAKGGNQWETGMVPMEELSRLIDWAHANDLEFHVTENNILSDDLNKQNLELHKEIYGELMKVLISKQSSGVIAWNLWDVMHADERKKTGRITCRIGLWDQNLEPTPACIHLHELLENPTPLQ